MCKESPTLFWSYFEKIYSPFVSGLSVCILVALCVRMCVAGTNKFEDLSL